jgi:hypothetical protein
MTETPRTIIGPRCDGVGRLDAGGLRGSARTRARLLDDGSTDGSTGVLTRPATGEPGRFERTRMPAIPLMTDPPGQPCETEGLVDPRKSTIHDRQHSQATSHV